MTQKYFIMELSKSKISVLASLSSKKMRRKHQLFLAEGEKCALDTLGAFSLVNLVATKDWLEGRPQLPADCSDKILVATADQMRKISSLSTAPEVLAVFRLPEEEEGPITLAKDELHLMIDGVQDPGNLGTIIRTADWFGFKEIICSNDTVDIFNPKTVQATMGSLKRVKVKYSDLKGVIEGSGIENVYGTLLNGKDIFKTSLKQSGIIVMGNEGNGISAEIRDLVTDPLLIPAKNPMDAPESLNVAIATAITLAQFVR